VIAIVAKDSPVDTNPRHPLVAKAQARLERRRAPKHSPAPADPRFRATAFH
jgi:hypothetical protein